MAWSKLIDLELDDHDRGELPGTPLPMPSRQKMYPWGLAISFDHKTLEKLGLDVPEVGDLLDARIFAEVTNVSISDSKNGPCCHVEAQIVKIALEDEMQEGPDEMSEEMSE